MPVDFEEILIDKLDELISAINSCSSNLYEIQVALQHIDEAGLDVYER